MSAVVADTDVVSLIFKRHSLSDIVGQLLIYHYIRLCRAVTSALGKTAVLDELRNTG